MDKKSKLQQMLEYGDMGCRSYSGRAMYGADCLGVEVSDLGEFVANVLEACSDNGEEPEVLSEIAQSFRRMRTDSMGRDIIVYFPGVPFVGDEEEEEDEEHDCSGPECCTPA